MNQVHIPHVTAKRNGSLLPKNPPSIFRQDPRPEIDMAWHRIKNINPIPLSSTKVRGNGYDPEIVARWPNVYSLAQMFMLAVLMYSTRFIVLICFAEKPIMITTVSIRVS